MQPFIKNDYPTIGVEEEFHIVDPSTGDLKNCVEDVISSLDENMRERICYELFNCVIENRTGIYKTPDELVSAVLEGRRTIAAACLEADARLASSLRRLQSHNGRQ